MEDAELAHAWGELAASGARQLILSREACRSRRKRSGRTVRMQRESIKDKELAEEDGQFLSASSDEDAPKETPISKITRILLTNRSLHVSKIAVESREHAGEKERERDDRQCYVANQKTSEALVHALSRRYRGMEGDKGSMTPHIHPPRYVAEVLRSSMDSHH